MGDPQTGLEELALLAHVTQFNELLKLRALSALIPALLGALEDISEYAGEGLTHWVCNDDEGIKLALEAIETMALVAIEKAKGDEAWPT